MSETNRKSPRTFQCRDALWTKFEELARELECSVDYLINDAMKQYARQRGQTATASQTGLPVPPPPPPTPSLPGGTPPSSRAPAPPSMTPAALPKVPIAAAPPMAAAPPPKAPPPPGASRGPAPPPLSTASTMPTMPGRVPPPPLAPPAPPSSRAPGPPPPQTPAMVPPAAPPTQARPLFLHYDGEAFPVTKERFFIGRGKQSSDLTIRDPNVSRQHAVVEFVGGVFYMVDMGSTNGIEFAGQRVHRKAIQHGDVYKICDHQIVCSYQ